MIQRSSRKPKCVLTEMVLRLSMRFSWFILLFFSKVPLPPSIQLLIRVGVFWIITTYLSDSERAISNNPPILSRNPEWLYGNLRDLDCKEEKRHNSRDFKGDRIQRERKKNKPERGRGKKIEGIDNRAEVTKRGEWKRKWRREKGERKSIQREMERNFWSKRWRTRKASPNLRRMASLWRTFEEK